MIKNKSSWFLFSIAIFFSQLGRADVEIDLLDARTKSELGWDAKVDPAWVADKAGNQRYVMKIHMNPPSPIVAIQAKATVLSRGKGDGETTLLTDSLREFIRVKFANGSVRDIRFNLKVEERRSIEDGCEQFGIKLKDLVEQDQPKFYIAVKCVQKDDTVNVWISTPRGVKWLETSIPEFAGKGKTTRGFEVNPNLTKTDQGRAGEFVFADGANRYSYAIVIENGGGEKKTAIFAIRAGLISISYTNSGIATSGMKPHMSVLMEQRPFSERIPVGVQLDASFASPGENFVKLSSINLFTGYTFGGASFTFEPRLYFFMADGSSQKGNSFFTFLYMGTGVEMGLKVGLGLLRSELQFTTSGQNQLMGANLEYVFRRVNEVGEPAASWGVYAGMTQMQVEAKDLIKLSAMSAGILRRF